MLSLKTCLSFQLSAWTLHHQCFQINCFLSLSVTLDIHLSSLPPHFQSISHFIMRNVRICITPPVIKNTIKNLTSDLQWNISSALSEVLDLACIIEKKCIISTDILKVTFMILICFDLCNLFVCRKWPKEKPSLGCVCVWECVRACQKTQIMKFMIWQTAEQLVWLSQLAEPAHCLIHRQFSVGWTEAQTHSYNSCDVSL